MKNLFSNPVHNSIFGADRDGHILCPVCKKSCSEPEAVDIHIDPWRMTCLGVTEEAVLFDEFIDPFHRREPELNVWYQCDGRHQFVVRYPIGKGSTQLKAGKPLVINQE